MARNLRYPHDIKAAEDIDVNISIGQIPASTSAAEEALAEATVRLQQAKVEALLGIRYDSDEFDALVARYRAAKWHADAARQAALHGSSAQSTKQRAGAPPVSQTYAFPATGLSA